jgi:hypothetical protein
MMKTILDISTILGGAAAIGFFWKEFSSLRRRRAVTKPSLAQPSIYHPPPITSARSNRSSHPSIRVRWKREEHSEALSLIGAISGMCSGGVAWLIGVKYGLVAIGVSFIVFIISILIDVVFEKDNRDHPVVHAIVTGVEGAVLVAILSAVISIFTDATSGLMGVAFGAVVGTLFGFRYGDGDPLKFPF